MKRVILSLLLLVSKEIAADVKISALPLNSSPSSVNTNDSFPYVNSAGNGLTERLHISSLPATPAFVNKFAQYAPIASPTFTGIVTGFFSGPLTGNVTGNVSGTATNVTGVVASSNGGTGSSNAFTLWGIPYASSTSTLSTTGPGTSGQVLTSNGTSAPIWATPSPGFLNPMTTLGDLIFENSTPSAARLAGSTSATKQFLTQTGTGSISAAPAWGAISAGDVPTLNQNTTGTAGNLLAAGNAGAVYTSNGGSTAPSFQLPVINNFLVNPSFELGAGSWTITGATATVNTTNFHDGAQSLSLALSGAGSLSQDVVPAQNLAGNNLEAGIWVNTTDPTTQVCARGAGIEAACQIVPPLGKWIYVNPNEGAPSSGSIGIDVKWSSSSGTILVDQAKVGVATNLFQVSQAQYLGSISWPIGTNGSCSWSIPAGGTMASLTANGACNPVVTGSLSAPATNIPGFVVPQMGPGTLMIQWTGEIVNSGSGYSGTNIWFWDGTKGSTDGLLNYNNGGTGVAGVFTSSLSYSTVQSNLTVQLQGFGTNSAGGIVYADSTSVNTGFNVYFFPSTSQTAITNTLLSMLGTDFYTPAATCPVGSIPEDGTAYILSAHPELVALANSMPSSYTVSGVFTVPNKLGIYTAGAGSQTFGGVTYTETLGAYTNDAFMGHAHQAQGVWFVYSGGAQVAYTDTNFGTGVPSTSAPTDMGYGAPRYGPDTHPAHFAETPCISYATQSGPTLINTLNGVTTFGSAPNANGLSVSSNNLILQPADSTHPGGVSTTAQTFAGSKTFGVAGADAVTFGSSSSTAIHKINGALNVTTRTITGNFTVDTTTSDYEVLANCSTTCTITLPAPTNGRELQLVDINGQSQINNIILAPHASENINGTSGNYTLAGNSASWAITSDGTNWFVKFNPQPTWAFGGGVDGAITITASNTTSGPLTSGVLTRDAYWSKLTMGAGGKFTTGGYRIFAQVCDFSSAITGAISMNGGNAGNGATVTTGGTAGAAAPGVTVGISTAGIVGGAGSATAGVQGGASTATSPGQGGPSGAGGAGGLGSGGAGGASRAQTVPASGAAFSRFATDLLRGITLMQGGVGAPGGSGAGGNTTAGSGGGGGGGGGGILYLACGTVIRGANTNPSIIEALGGAGGNGGTTATTNAGGGGGGPGGGGGWIYFLYSYKTGSSITNALDASGGQGGAGGNGIGTGVGGAGAGGGGGGRIDQFNISTGIGTEIFGGTATTANAASGVTGGALKAGQITQSNL